MPRGKKRLYLAFFERLPTQRQPEKYHTSLLLSPKNPDVKTDAAARATLYHAVNRIDPTVRKQVWKYESMPTRPRSPSRMVVGLVLLGKHPDNTFIKIKEILEAIPVKNDDPNWWCYDWAWEAMSVSTLVHYDHNWSLTHYATRNSIHFCSSGTCREGHNSNAS